MPRTSPRSAAEGESGDGLGTESVALVGGICGRVGMASG